jgi:hypothetical protein
MAIRKTNLTVEIPEPRFGVLELGIVGLTPFICERMSEKAKRELLYPSGRKTAADKAQNLKHDPVEEFRASAYTLADTSAPTLLAFVPAAFKKAMALAAIDVPGAAKAQTERLVWVAGMRAPLWGPPRLLMSVTRAKDINKTPDIRTRAILPAWAMTVTVQFSEPVLTAQAVSNLLATAGHTVGVGGWRVEKGSGDYGQFRVCGTNDPELVSIMKSYGRTAQVKAMEEAIPYDEESAELFEWYVEEVKRRGRTSTPTNAKAPRKAAARAKQQIEKVG